MRTVYADNAASTAMCPEAIRAMTDCLQIYGNPSGLHSAGQAAAKILMDARETVAKCLNAAPNEIYFTSGGTEADNWALRNAARLGLKKGKTHIITTAFEHHAVLHTLKALEKEGFSVTYLDVHADGYVTPAQVADAITENTCLVTVMFANNEIGTIQPIAEIGAVCREKGVTFHTDAVQAVGHIPVDVQTQNIDMLSLSAHKFHGPKGVGVLYCRKGISLLGMMQGGAQERGRRPGTENTPAIAGMAAALQKACETMEANAETVAALRDRIMDTIMRTVPRMRLNGGREPRLPGNINFCFEGIEGESLLLYLDLKGICASSGSACTSGSLDPSHVLLALGLPHEIAHGSLRLSLCEYNTPEDADQIIKTLPAVVERLRDMSPVWEKIMKEEQANGIQ